MADLDATNPKSFVGSGSVFYSSISNPCWQHRKGGYKILSECFTKIVIVNLIKLSKKIKIWYLDPEHPTGIHQTEH